ncbi:MAG: hypothetical protein P8I83_03435 [Paracoccaceae bacterium]|nr:hypothetical protein [Paracoccaceae bacterium]
MNPAKIITAALFALSASTAYSGDPVLDEYGELRSYHRDWLVICEGARKGVCRADKILLAPTKHMWTQIR